jgi:hypothetical protein
MRTKSNPAVLGEPVILYDKRGRRTKFISKAASFQFKGLSKTYLKKKIPFPRNFRGKALREFFVIEVIALYRETAKRRAPKRKVKYLRASSGRHFSRRLPSTGRPYRNFFKFKKNYPQWHLSLDPEVFHEILERDILPLFSRYHERLKKEHKGAKFKNYHGYFYIGIEMQNGARPIRYTRTLEVVADPAFFLRFALMRYGTWWRKHNYDGMLFLNGFKAMIETESKKPWYMASKK